MFIGATRHWVSELQKEGKLAGRSPEEIEKIALEYAERLEEIYYREVKDQMEKIGKSAEFERMMLYDTQYLSKYLNQTIPAFPAFRYEIFEKAKKEILGD